MALLCILWTAPVYEAGSIRNATIVCMSIIYAYHVSQYPGAFGHAKLISVMSWRMAWEWCQHLVLASATYRSAKRHIVGEGIEMHHASERDEGARLEEQPVERPCGRQSWGWRLSLWCCMLAGSNTDTNHAELVLTLKCHSACSIIGDFSNAWNFRTLNK